jgi:hypothetical protein
MVRNPEKRERRRRRLIHIQGRLGASQDVAALADKLPPEPERLVGLAQLKYLPANPANSIVLCEDWSGLRAHHSPALVSSAKYAC